MSPTLQSRHGQSAPAAVWRQLSFNFDEPIHCSHVATTARYGRKVPPSGLVEDRRSERAL